MQNEPELYQPDVHVSVGCLLSPQKCPCQYNSNVLIPSGCNILCCRYSLAAEEDVRIMSLCPTCLPVASMKKEDSMLFDFRLMLNSDLLYLC